jgi:hypothetical protein
MSETVHEQSLARLAERLVRENQRDAALAATDPRNGEQGGGR